MKKNTFKKAKKRLLILIGCGSLFISAWCFLSFNQTLSPDSLLIVHVKVSENEIKIEGYPNGLFEFSKCTTKYTDGNLYIKFRGGIPFPFVNRKNDSGAFAVQNIYPELSNIYLHKSNNGKNDRLIWSAKTGEITNRTDDPLGDYFQSPND